MEGERQKIDCTEWKCRDEEWRYSVILLKRLTIKKDSLSYWVQGFFFFFSKQRKLCLNGEYYWEENSLKIDNWSSDIPKRVESMKPKT